MATMRDVARLAGVSVSTVSLCLTNSGPVGAETRSRVEAAARDLNYHTGPVEHGGKRGRSRLIGILLGDVYNPFFGRMLDRVDAAVSAVDHMLIVSMTGIDKEREIRALDQLRRYRPAGVLMAPLRNNAALQRRLRTLDMPAVLVDQNVDDVRLDFVGSDNTLATRMLTEYLARMGHRRICYLGGRLDLSNSVLRRQGFRDGLAATGVPESETMEITADYSADQAYAQTMRVMTMSLRPTAILAASNMMAIGALQAIADLGFNCPRDVSLCGVDEVPWGGVIQPRITTVAQPVDELADIAAAWLLERIIGRGGPPRQHIAVPKLILGSSCQPPAS